MMEIGDEASTYILTATHTATHKQDSMSDKGAQFGNVVKQAAPF